MKFMPGTVLAKNFKTTKWTVTERTIFQSLDSKGRLQESVVLTLKTAKGAKKIVHEEDAVKQFVQREKVIYVR